MVLIRTGHLEVELCPDFRLDFLMFQELTENAQPDRNNKSLPTHKSCSVSLEGEGLRKEVRVVGSAARVAALRSLFLLSLSQQRQHSQNDTTATRQLLKLESCTEPDSPCFCQAVGLSRESPRCCGPAGPRCSRSPDSPGGTKTHQYL